MRKLLLCSAAALTLGLVGLVALADAPAEPPADVPASWLQVVALVNGLVGSLLGSAVVLAGMARAWGVYTTRHAALAALVAQNERSCRQDFEDVRSQVTLLTGGFHAHITDHATGRYDRGR